MNEAIFRYNPDKNPDGRFLTGVPLADLTQAQFDELPEWSQRSVLACEFYEPVVTPTYGPQLENIKGIGPKTVNALRTAGIHTVADLVSADPAMLDTLLEGSATADRVQEWQQQAQKLLDKEK